MDSHFADAPAWPEQAPQAAGSVPGHNRPSLDEEARQQFNEAIDQRDGFRKRIEDLVGSAEKAYATDEASLGRCGELVKQIRAAGKVIEDVHKTTKQPYLDAGRVVDDMKKSMIGPLEAAKAKVEAKQNQYLEEQRQMQIAAERRRREEEAARAKEAAASDQPAGEISVPPPPPPVTGVVARGDYGTAVSAQTVAVPEIVDYDLAYIKVAQNVKVREAIETAIKALVRAGERDIPGVKITEQAKVSNR